MKEVKVVFLDCDGVLNTSNPDDYDREMKNTRDYADFYLPRCVTHLNHITDKTGAKIVVSSTWRLGETVESMQKIFSEMGITGQVIDLTSTSNSIRGLEIKNWLEHKSKDGGFSVESYVILDDDCDMLYEEMLKSVGKRGSVATSYVREIPNEILHEALRETIENMVMKKL